MDAIRAGVELRARWFHAGLDRYFVSYAFSMDHLFIVFFEI